MFTSDRCFDHTRRRSVTDSCLETHLVTEGTFIMREISKRGKRDFYLFFFFKGVTLYFLYLFFGKNVRRRQRPCGKLQNLQAITIQVTVKKWALNFEGQRVFFHPFLP